MKGGAAVTGALATVLVAGCALGPNYERPKVTSPPSYRFASGAETPASLADLPWWKVFRDDALHALVREALRRNYDLMIAAARVDAARAQARAAGAQLLPGISGAGTGNYGNSFLG